MDKIAETERLIKESNKIVFFGGAGVSTESGIPDFRSAEGVYSQKYSYSPEVILSRDFFFECTKEFFDFYFAKMVFPFAKPNSAHLKLAEMEQMGRLSCVITQNIDGLHYAAGSKNVCEFHGTVHRNHCLSCGKEYDLQYVLEQKDGIPRCACGGTIKPDVVLYGEAIPTAAMEQAVNEIESCDLLIVGGTSLKVQPAASLAYMTKAQKIVVNKSAQELDIGADIVVNEPIGEFFSKIKL